MLDEGVRMQVLSHEQDIFFNVLAAIEGCHLAEQPEIVDGVRDMLFWKAEIGCFGEITAKTHCIHLLLSQDRMAMVIYDGNTGQVEHAFSSKIKIILMK